MLRPHHEQCCLFDDAGVIRRLCPTSSRAIHSSIGCSTTYDKTIQGTAMRSRPGDRQCKWNVIARRAICTDGESEWAKGCDAGQALANWIVIIITRNGRVGYPQFGTGLPVVLAKKTRGLGKKGRSVGNRLEVNCRLAANTGKGPMPPGLARSQGFQPDLYGWATG
jgi:hypothetical protein